MGQSQSHNKAKQHQGYFNPQYEVIRIVDDIIYGRIKHVKEKDSKNVYILKELAFNANKFLDEEVELLKARVSFDHPNIVKMIGYNVLESQQLCSKMFKIFIFIEKLNEDLDSELRERIANEDAYSENDLLFIAESMTSLLYNLQMRNMNHGDIRPLNIFYSAKDQAYKLTDPQLEVDRRANGLTKAIIHQAETFLAPEVLVNVPKKKVEHNADPYKMDVFSLGATLLGLATLSHSEELFDYKTGALNEDLLNERLKRVQDMYSNFTYELILDMLAYDDYNRPNFIDLEDKFLPYHEVIRQKKALPFKTLKKGNAFVRSIEEMGSKMPPIYEVEEKLVATSKASAINAKPLDSIEILSEEPEVGDEKEEKYASAPKIPAKSDKIFLTSSADFLEDDYPDKIDIRSEHEQEHEEEQIKIRYEYMEQIKSQSECMEQQIKSRSECMEEIKSRSECVEQIQSESSVELEDDLEMKIKRALERTQETYKQVQQVETLPVFERPAVEEEEDETVEDIITRRRNERKQKSKLHPEMESYVQVETFDIETSQKDEVTKPQDTVERRDFISFGNPNPNVYELKKLEENSPKVTTVDPDFLRSKEVEEIVKAYLKPNNNPGTYALEEASVSLKASSDPKDFYSVSHTYSSYLPKSAYTTSNFGIPDTKFDKPFSSEVVSATSTVNNYGYPLSQQHDKSLSHYSYLPISYFEQNIGNNSVKLNL